MSWAGDYLKYISYIYGFSVQEKLNQKAEYDFSIVLPVRNTTDTLRYTLITCLNQRYQGSYEVVLSDNSDSGNHGQSPYSASKIGADQIAMSFYNAFGTPVALIRPFNTYGPRQSARAVIPTIITQIANGKRKIKLGALSPTRDFNYVKDTVQGFISIAESEKSVGEVINIGSNFEVSIGETAKLIAEAMAR